MPVLFCVFIPYLINLISLVGVISNLFATAGISYSFFLNSVTFTCICIIFFVIYLFLFHTVVISILFRSHCCKNPLIIADCSLSINRKGIFSFLLTMIRKSNTHQIIFFCVQVNYDTNIF